MSPPFSKNGFLKQNLSISYLVIVSVLGRNSREKNERKKSKNREKKHLTGLTEI